jgi:hypothetical protein
MIPHCEHQMDETATDPRCDLNGAWPTLMVKVGSCHLSRKIPIVDGLSYLNPGVPFSVSL